MKINVTKQYVLNYIGEMKVFSLYLNVPEDIIRYCLDNNKKIKNPLRIDNNPSLGFIVDKRGKLRMYDFASSVYRGDCFQCAALALNLNCSDKRDFIYILKDIVHRNTGTPMFQNNIFTPTKKETKILTYDIRSWNVYDTRFWKQYGLEHSDIIPISTLYVNGQITYLYHKNDPAYVYELYVKNNIQIIEVYLPLRKRDSGKPRFITNNRNQIKSVKGLKPCDIIILTKSVKDSKVINHIATLSSFYVGSCSVISIPISTESAIITKSQYEALKEYADNIIGIFDNDAQGEICGKSHFEKYGIKYFLTGDKDYKDISDYRSLYGEGLTISFLKEIISKLI